MRKHGEGSITRRSDGRWQGRYRYTDERGVAKRAQVYGRSEKEARQQLRDLIRRVDDGGPVSDSTVTLGAWAERWITTTLPSSSRRLTTQVTYASLIRTHIIPSLGHLRLRDLTAGHVEAWTLDLGSRRSASTTRQAHGLLVMLLDTAMRHDLLRRNVAKLTDRPAKPHTEAEYYSSAEVAALREAAVGHRLSALLTLTAYTGLRKGEALALRWSDVILDGQHPHLRITGTLARHGRALVRTEPKTAAGRRTVPLVPEALAALHAARRQQARERLAAGPAWTDSGYVFTTEMGTPVDPRNALRWFYGIRDAAALSLMLADPHCQHDDDSTAHDRACARCGRASHDYLGGSLHTLRHSAASVLLAAGVPMPVVKDVLGHSSITITVDMYGHMAPTVVADAMTAGMAGYGI